VVRPDEANNVVTTSDVTDEEDVTRTFVNPLATELTVKRSFNQPGRVYTLTMYAQNMHNKDDDATMTWKVSPVCVREEK